MIGTNEFKTGMTISFGGNIYQIIEFLHVKPGKGAAYVTSKLRNLRTGAVIDHTFRAGEKMERAQIDKIKMQFLYSDGGNYIFMNTDTYDQVEIPEERIEYEKNFILEGMSLDVTFYNGKELLGVMVPERVDLTVIETVPGVRGDTKTNALKDAIVETGLLVKVPLFIEQGEKISVNTTDGSYVSRSK